MYSIQTAVVSKGLAAGLIAGVIGAALSGCSSLGNLPPSLTTGSSNTLGSTSGASQLGQVRPRALVALGPITGPSPEVAQRLARHLDAAATRNNLAVLVDQPSATGDYRLQGHILMARENKGVVMVFLWQVLDTNGNRLEQISGSEPLAAGAPTGDPWANVSDALLSGVAEKAVVAVIASDAPGARAPAPGSSAPVRTSSAPGTESTTTR